MRFLTLISQLLVTFLCFALPAQAAEPLNVFVSVLPQQYFVERIGGAAVNVQAMVKPGDSPATYEPSPRQIAALAEAELYIRIGVPFEDAWMSRIQAVNRSMPVMDAREDLELRTLEAHHHEGEHHDHHKDHDHQPEAEQDPHVWTSPVLVKQMAVAISKRLSQLRPELKSQFEENYQLFATELDALHTELEQLLASSKSRKFMVYHPSWGYFADTYDLEQVAIEHEGKEPTAKALAKLIEQAKQEQVTTIFVQPQFDKRAAQQVAKAISGKVEAVDPLSTDYFANLRHTARLIAGATDE